MFPSQETRRWARQLELKTPPRFARHLSGPVLSRRRGEGMDFREVRQFEEGDDARRIDPLATARNGTPFVRSWNEDRQINVALVLDTGLSLDFGSGNFTKRDIINEIAALLLLGFSQRMYALSVITTGPDGRPALARLRNGQGFVLSWLQNDLLPARTERFDLEGSLQMCRAHFHHSSVIIVVSDFLSAPRESFIKVLKERHSVMCIRVLDRLEKNMLESAGQGAMPLLAEFYESSAALDIPRRMVLPAALERFEQYFSRLAAHEVDCDDYHPRQTVEYMHRV